MSAASGSKQKDGSGGGASGKTVVKSNATKGWVESLDHRDEDEDESKEIDGAKSKSNEAGWCIVHLYREDEESGPARNTRSKAAILEAARDTISTPPLRSSTAASNASPPTTSTLEESSILCIPSVPSHITPSDFLSWVGADTMNKVSHFRMVMTGETTRYLVLIKFRESKDARWWNHLWNGRRFDSGGVVDEETASVLFVRRVIFETPTVDISTTGRKKEASESGSERSYGGSSERSFPDMKHDPFTPSPNTTNLSMSGNDNGNNSTLSEIPTCPVCLERMDMDPSDPTASPSSLLTILCQHVFHCACLQKWRGSGCPVCRHTQNKSPPLRTYAGQQGRAPFGRNPGEAEACSVCGCEEDLWICLVCGNVGCGRYKGGHAKRHWLDSRQLDDEDEEEDTENAVGGHNYALEIQTQHVWDYVGDKWVHRLIMDQGDRKLAPNDEDQARPENGVRERSHDMEMVPREKLETIGLEYTHLLTSSLDSQRLYFEDILNQTKAASASASLLQSQIDDFRTQVLGLTTEISLLKTETIPLVEKERDRANTKAEKSTEIARGLAKSLAEEKEVSKGLMKRIEHINTSMAALAQDMSALREENAELKEQNRDLGFFISGGEKIKGLEGDLGEEVREGSVSVPVPLAEKGKGKGKGKKK